MVRDRRASEFGGRPGRIQPAPHEPTNTETLSLIYGTEPAASRADVIEPVSSTPPPIRPEQDPEGEVPVTARVR